MVQNLVGNALKYSAPETRVQVQAQRLGTEVIVAFSDRRPSSRVLRMPLVAWPAKKGRELSPVAERLTRGVLCRSIRTHTIFPSALTSRFLASLPALIAAARAGRRFSTAGSQEDRGARRRQGPEERRLFLIEDNPADVDLVREALLALPYAVSVSTAFDGERGLAKLREEARRGVLPDVIFLDLNLPRLTGHEVLARLKADPAFQEVPVVVVTSSSREEGGGAPALLADEFVTKPLDVYDYFSRIQAAARAWLE